MIENIKIKSNSPFSDEIKTIEFGRVNTIIGPKGGGKSTLFDLLANIPKQAFLSTVEDALKNHGLEIVSVTIDGETIPFNGFSKQKVKDEKQKNSWYENRNDVIYQDDPIKKNLSASQTFDKAKMDFAKKLTYESKDPIKFVDKIRTLYDAIYKVVLKDRETINWANALDMASPSNAEEKVIFDLNYSSRQLERVIVNDKSELKNMFDEIKDHINYYKNTILTYEGSANETQITKEFRMQTIKNLNIILDALRTQQLPIQDEWKRLDRIVKMANAFDEAYKTKVAEIKRNTQNVSKLAAYEVASRSHFMDMAKLLKKASFAFDDIVNATIELNLNETFPAENMLELAINETIILEQEDKYELLKKVLYNAKKVQEDVENWIEAARTNDVKEFKQDGIISHLASKIVKDKIKVLADGKDYETMSLGQKSIYGIRYKFNHAKGKAIFLDQPEDNLDNNTIATNILELINGKEEQVFIVTHNANIGILTKPDRVIVANFQDKEEDQNLDQYLVGTVKAEAKESDSAFYLEGGLQFIEDRLNIIKGDK